MLFTKKPTYTMDIAGAQLPERYDHPIAEYDALIQAAGMIDFSHLEWLEFRGADTINWLQGLLSQDVIGLANGRAADSFALDASGKIINLVTLYRFSSTHVLMSVPYGTAGSMLEHFNKFIIMEDVHASLTRNSMLSIQGPQSGECRTLLARADGTLFDTQRCRCGGFDVVLEASTKAEAIDILEHNATIPVGFTALNIARVEHFLPWFHIDMQMGANPLIFGKGNRISYDKGCYLGQETVAMTRDRGRPPALLVQLAGEGDQVPPAGTQLHANGKKIGDLTSVIFSPSHDMPMALAVINFPQAIPEQILTDSYEQTWRVTQVAQYAIGAS